MMNKPNNTIQTVDNILKRAIELKASDVHFEPRDDSLHIRFRQDGVLQNGWVLPKEQQAAIISRVKIMVDLDIAEQRLPQDGRTHFSAEGQNLDLRVSTIPTVHGEKAVIRLLNREDINLDLGELGFEGKDLTRYQQMLTRSHGIILISGPTGSGKTTTLYASLNKLDSEKLNITTVEDPVEYQLKNINQIPVNYKTGLTFAKGLRSILRQDPDVIMVGEIRDAETAKIAIQAALTGHLVFSTIHTNDAASAITRLVEMGIEPYLISSSLVGVVAQRLVRLKCPPCEKCNQSGYYGRSAIYEVLEVSDDVRNLINTKAPSNIIKSQAIKDGMNTLSYNGVAKVRMGITNREEIMRVVSLDG
jgi:type IV pilus assembly protein PilB